MSRLLAWTGDDPATAAAGQNVAFLLDRPLVVERGDVASNVAGAPKLTAVFDADIFWLSRQPLVAGAELTMQLAMRTVNVRIQAIRHGVDAVTLAPELGGEVAADRIASVTIRCGQPVAVDNFTELAATGRFVLRDGYQTVGGGVIDVSGYPDQRAIAAAPRDLSTTRHRQPVRGARRARARGRHGGERC